MTSKDSIGMPHLWCALVVFFGPNFASEGPCRGVSVGPRNEVFFGPNFASEGPCGGPLSVQRAKHFFGPILLRWVVSMVKHFFGPNFALVGGLFPTKERIIFRTHFCFVGAAWGVEQWAGNENPARAKRPGEGIKLEWV